MPERLPRRSLWGALIISCCVACSPPAPPAPTSAPPISEERAKRLAVEHFNETLAGRLHVKDPKTGQCSALPEIRLEDIDSAKLQDETWLIERNPLVGFIFSIRVARNGSWSAVEKAYIALE